MRVIVAEDVLITRIGIVRILQDADIEMVAETEDATTLPVPCVCRARASPASNWRSSDRRFARPVSGSVCDSCSVCSKRVEL